MPHLPFCPNAAHPLPCWECGGEKEERPAGGGWYTRRPPHQDSERLNLKPGKILFCGISQYIILSTKSGYDLLTMDMIGCVAIAGICGSFGLLCHFNSSCDPIQDPNRYHIALERLLEGFHILKRISKYSKLEVFLCGSHAKFDGQLTVPLAYALRDSLTRDLLLNPLSVQICAGRGVRLENTGNRWKFHVRENDPQPDKYNWRYHTKFSDAEYPPLELTHIITACGTADDIESEF